MKSFLRCSDQRGLSLIELIVAAGVFALLFLTIDSVFIGAHRSTQQAELSTDVDQNARIALDRLTREIREASPSEIVVESGPPDGVAFRSARSGSSLGDTRVFCLNVPSTSDRFYMGGGICDYYGGPPATGVSPYAPLWQRIVGYYLAPASGTAACGPYDLHRYVIDQTAPTTPAVLPPSSRGSVGLDTVVASCIEDFQVAKVPEGARTRLKVRLKGRGQRGAQGGVPVQEILLTGEAWIRND